MKLNARLIVLMPLLICYTCSPDDIKTDKLNDEIVESVVAEMTK